MSAAYNFSYNGFSLYNPYEYTIGFLDTLMFDEVCLRLKYELPEPASAIHVRSTRVLFYFVLLPVMSFVTYKMLNKI